MSRYTGSSYKQARRVGSSLLENGKEIKRSVGLLQEDELKEFVGE